MAVTAREQPTELKIHGNHRRSSLCCVIGIRSFTSAALQCGDIPVRPVGTPTNIPVTSRPKEESSSCKIHYQQSGLFLLGGACHGQRGGGRKARSCARMQSMRTILPSYRNKLAATWLLACTTTWKGREGVLSSASLDYFRAFTAEWPQFLHAGKWQVRETVIVLLLNLAWMKALSQLQT